MMRNQCASIIGAKQYDILHYYPKIEESIERKLIKNIWLASRWCLDNLIARIGRPWQECQNADVNMIINSDILGNII
jgi:hypothetical protein